MNDITETTIQNNESDTDANVVVRPVVMWRAVYEGSGDAMLFGSKEKAEGMIGSNTGKVEKVIVITAEQLAEWCEEAADDISSWACYANDYFKEKHDLNHDLDNWRNRAAQFDT